MRFKHFVSKKAKECELCFEGIYIDVSYAQKKQLMKYLPPSVIKKSGKSPSKERSIKGTTNTSSSGALATTKALPIASGYLTSTDEKSTCTFKMPSSESKRLPP